MPTITELQQRFETYLQAHRFVQAPQALYEPANYILALGGKRMRPVLALLGYHLFKDDVDAALPAAMAVEVFHNFSLIHDDIMDQAPMRRGQPTVHQRYGLNAGILSGDVMLILAYEFLLKTQPTHIVPELIGILNKAAKEVCEGQQYDMNFETSKTVSIAEYLTMIELKTAVLLAASLELGALAALASPNDRAHLNAFGRLTGIAFQLQDDYLDAFGDPSLVGKQAGGDIIQNKKTFLYLKALEIANPSQKQTLQYWYQTPDVDPQAKVAAVTDLMRQLDIPALTQQLRDEYQAAGFAHLDAVNSPEEKKVVLRQLAWSLLNRVS